MARTAARETARPSRRRGGPAGCIGAVFNLLANALLVLTALSGLAIGLIYVYPNVLTWVPGGSDLLAATVPATAVVLVPPGTTPPTLVDTSGQVGFPTLPPEWTATETPTITPTPRPRTASPEPSATSPLPSRTPTRTHTPQATPTRTPSFTPVGPTPLPTNTRSAFNYTLQPGSPTYLSNFLNNNGCNWFGIAGRAFGTDDRPVISLMVKVISGETELPPVLTGSAPAIGSGGYEVYLGDHPVQTSGVYKVQLFSNTGQPLSQQYSIDTQGDCTKNLILVNFVQNH